MNDAPDLRSSPAYVLCAGQPSFSHLPRHLLCSCHKNIEFDLPCPLQKKKKRKEKSHLLFQSGGTHTRAPIPPQAISIVTIFS
ncbi:hypothetical protein I7I50_08033 [Histoplasma capsulatum G186AR]|uniref:Uncharacterized protein n=1 Tax=Ajellomyces capsulatus TaxID=5037 RepID=A0A8H8CVJ2_AJECA|nr:hypothetical protein I7I52_08549 [Histoplasma capsulatum]QSS68577.1 hypothetical protein I7I50_08033 [Histoplasma capsulatum G186AR]